MTGALSGGRIDQTTKIMHDIRRLRAQLESPIVVTQDDRRLLPLILLFLLDGTFSGVFVNQK